MEKKFVFNGDFKCLVGHEYFVDGEIRFPPGQNEKVDGTYRTRFGPCVPHNGLIYANTDNNNRLAQRRLTAKRFVEGRPDDLHDQLFANQERFVREHCPILEGFRDKYAPYFHEFDHQADEARRHYADPHEKKELRIQGYKEMVEDGIINEDSCWMKSTWWKLKKNEWAKPGKYPRTIGDLGVVASLLGFRLTNYLKSAQNEEILEVNGGHLQFCKAPYPAALHEVFENLRSPPGRFYFVYFSDDACLAIRRGNEVHRFNLDISSCDASHGPVMFELLKKMVPKNCRRAMHNLVKQCQTPLRVYSNVDRKRVCILQPTRPMLYSGSTITTAINNLANILIGLSIAELDYSDPAQIARAAERAGYIVTGGERPLEKFEDLQFLKHSPVLGTDSVYHPLLNLGVLLRASGTCNGDLPGRGDMEKRGLAFQRGLLQGAYPYSRFRLLELMRSAVGGGDVCKVAEKLFTGKTGGDEYPHYVCQDESLYSRYRLEPQEVADLEHLLGRASFGDCVNCTAIDKILALDYGLNTTEFEDVTYLNSQ